MLDQKASHGAWIENRFFPQHRDYSQLLTRYTEEISETVGTSAVAALVARTLKQTLDLAGAYLIIEQSDGQFQLLAKVTNFEPIDVEDESLGSLRRLLHEFARHHRAGNCQRSVADTVARMVQLCGGIVRPGEAHRGGGVNPTKKRATPGWAAASVAENGGGARGQRGGGSAVVRDGACPPAIPRGVNAEPCRVSADGAPGGRRSQ